MVSEDSNADIGRTVDRISPRGSISRRRLLQASAATSAALSVGGVGTAAGQESTVPEEANYELLTDGFNVSHAFADDQYSLFFAQGYDQARYRLWQMHLLRSEGLTDDEMNRLYDLPDRYQQMYEEAPEEVREVLDGFADGVNAWIDEAAQEERLPVEFEGEPPREWEPVDTIACLALQIGSFGTVGGNELRNSRWVSKLYEESDSLEVAYDILGDINWLWVDEHHTPSIPADEKTVDGSEEILPFEDVPDEQFDLALKAPDAEPFDPDPDLIATTDATSVGTETPNVGLAAESDAEARSNPVPPSFGSNGFLVHGDLTDTGEPMMFGGPMMGTSKPPAIHEVGLHGAGFDVTGVAVPGIPGIVIGRTENFAWSVLTGKDEQIDTVVLDIREEDGTLQYRWEGEWHDIEGDEDGYRAGEMPIIAWNPDDDVVWAQRYLPRGQEIESWWDWIQIGTLDTLEEFEAAIDGLAFSYHFIYADDENIAYYATGRVPERHPDVDPRLPITSQEYMWDDETDIRATHDERDTWIVNPDQGYVVCWNNSPAVGWRAGTSRDRWGSIHEVDLMDFFVRYGLLDEEPVEITLQDVADVNAFCSVHHQHARALVPHVLEFVEVTDDPVLEAMADHLEAWLDDDLTTVADEEGHHPGYTIWETFRSELDEQFFVTALGDLEGEMRDKAKPSILLDIFEGRADFDWCGEVADADSCAEVIVEAMDDAREILEEEYDSEDPADWRMEQQLTTFGSIGAAFTDQIPELERGSWNHVVAPGADLDGSWGILPPGNSGYITLSEYQAMEEEGREAEPDRLSDQLEMYAEFEYKRLPVTREQIETVIVSSYADEEGIVHPPGVLEAIDDWRDDKIDTPLVLDVIDAWRDGEPVI